MKPKRMAKRLLPANRPAPRRKVVGSLYEEVVHQLHGESPNGLLWLRACLEGEKVMARFKVSA